MTSLFDLTGKKAVVVGGAGGIGQAIAEAFAEAGAQVMISSRNEESLKRAIKELKESTGADIGYFVCDATKEPEVEALLAAALEQMGTVDILMNSQGFNKKFPAHEFPGDVWDEMFNTNVKSMMFTCKHIGGYMYRNGIHGKIINISSVRGIRAIGNGGMGNSGYCATKGAVEMLTKSYASEYGPGIQVNAIGPTITYTPMMYDLLPADETARNNIAASMPGQRIGYPDDCKGPAIFLASAASDFVTGSTIYPDGGLTACG